MSDNNKKRVILRKKLNEVASPGVNYGTQKFSLYNNGPWSDNLKTTNAIISKNSSKNGQEVPTTTNTEANKVSNGDPVAIKLRARKNAIMPSKI